MSGAIAISLPAAFEHWNAATQAATIGALTFVQEDLPVITAAILATAGRITWQAAYLGSFLGIWIGDALLYLVARAIGPNLLRTRMARSLVRPEALAKSEAWFAERGLWVLLLSRAVPGARLPTYLAAGFLKAPFGRFLLVTGLAVASWTGAIFLLAWSAGPTALTLTQQFGSAVTWVLVALLSIFLARGFLRRSKAAFWTKAPAYLSRWAHWEFWPAWLFYTPVVINYLVLALRYRGWALPTAANPGIFSGGIVGESKLLTLAELQRSSPEFTARAWLLPSTTESRFEKLEKLRARHAIDYPFILKPDVGQRGAGVKLIRQAAQSRDYFSNVDAALLLQEYAPGPHEAGVFYYRFPDQERGRIFGITEKIFPEIAGDGVRTVEQLIRADPRARMLASKYLKRFAQRRDEILACGERLRLVEAGNHAQGCIFRDGMHLRTAQLEDRIDEISRKLDGFFIGRFDIRFESAEDLRAGRNFKIIELNGAAAEATNIYDARNSLLSAYRILFQQWDLVFAIGAANRARGHACTPAAVLWRAWRRSAGLIATYPRAD
jgi:membrane protein DedA with SNARE-associated domain